MWKSYIASDIDNEYKRKQYYKNRVKRMKCIIDEKKQCDKCKYEKNCIDAEIEDY